MKKSLSEMTLAELWELFPIVLEPYNPMWEVWFFDEAAELRRVLGDGVARISHIGSTAVKGLLAKPTVDILAELHAESGVAFVKERLLSNGWLLMSERLSSVGENKVSGGNVETELLMSEIPSSIGTNKVSGGNAETELLLSNVSETPSPNFRLSFNKGYTPDGYAERVFHLHVVPLGECGEIYFRDFLRANAEVAREYERLKLSLKQKYEHDRDAYTAAKAEFIAKYTVKPTDGVVKKSGE
ncbi:MAG: GrpB family protein [Clostridiales bacterium]|jgi:GrpB-like predicted nucleotidyltransferase (UPF0157 family)|nr:GrpB family protein [Clostridiales bacterium]